MKVFISGSSGFIGSNLKSYLSYKGFEVYSLNRSDFNLDNNAFTNIIHDADIIINLSGYPIYKPWTKRNYTKILNSRIKTNLKFYESLKTIKNTNIIYITASAIGIYDDIHIHDEESKSFAKDKLYNIVREWENAALNIKSIINNFYILRLGLVISKEKGFLNNILKFVKLFIFPYPINNPSLSIIHINDVIKAIYYLIKKKPSNSTFNLVCKEWISNLDFLKLIKQYKLFVIIPLPKFVFRLIFGKRHILFTRGQKVIPKNLVDSNYDYKYPYPVDIINAVFQ